MGAYGLVAILVLGNNVLGNQVASDVQAPVANSVSVVIQAQQNRCNARPWQHLVGRTVGDLLTVRLPARTRVFRSADPQVTNLARGQLTVEIGRNTRVRRVYCS